ncbi:uncharacterized protein LOC109604740 isoform X2 [Aethina tumida]|uniref:uncharacterized protein LOC109604740 isoform X2 n=1 Tax=Aethina tumida TaxID=116153 RepID=UPI00096B5DBF|nr:uncharacterized protein LOC109604740 isoform X2 [Aethina tumida]
MQVLSEDDRDSSVVSDSDVLSIPPMTPPTPQSQDTLIQTQWSEDGIFKIPQNKEINNKCEDDANIALRTRSKLSLSATPLELIEEQFIPPDITTDMYDMDCDDEDWRDFLKKFTRPLDEVAKSAEDDDHDPEYNILSDIDKVNKEELREELRVDKAVKVSRKELNALMAELLEFTNCAFEKENIGLEGAREEITVQSIENESAQKNFEENPAEVLILRSQIPLLEQQLRQHVQILVQNFLLIYEHPEYHEHSLVFKEYLLNLKYLSLNKNASIFYILNLDEALDIVTNWQLMFLSKPEEGQKIKQHFENDICESLRRKNSGNYDYVSTIPPDILGIISSSKVFLYTSLLPRIPYKSEQFFSKKKVVFENTEDNLIALGLERFMPSPEECSDFRNKATIKKVSKTIQENILSTKSFMNIYNHIISMKSTRCANNPIKYYFQNKKAPSTTHYVYPLNQLKVIPPCERSPEELPLQIREYVCKNKQMENNNETQFMNETTVFVQPLINVLPPYNHSTKRVLLPRITNGVLLNKSSVLLEPIITSTPLRPRRSRRQANKKKKNNNQANVSSFLKSTPLENFIRILKQPTQSRKILQLSSSTITSPVSTLCDTTLTNSLSMLPSMPNLNTPVKNTYENVTTPISEVSSTRNILKNLAEELIIEPVENCKEADTSNESTSQLCIEKTVSKEVSKPVPEPAPIKSLSTNASTSAPKTSKEKDNLDDINALMIASSTVKSTKKEPSGAEKKRAKIRREFLANIAICSPQDPEQETKKDEMFAMAYYDKLRETLELDHYHKIMQILNEHEAGDAVDLYLKIMNVLRPQYNDLADEFLLFLRDREAAAVGQYIPWVKMSTRSKFLRKLEVYFKDQPAQLRKIFKSLTELSDCEDISIEKVKSTILPMLKGNAVLVDLFLQNFLNEPPPKSLLQGDYEQIDIRAEMSRTDSEILSENITIPDGEDVYGGSSCICSCHKIEDPEFKSRHRHCIPCGIKFIQGKIYIQSGRGLRPATVSFLTNSNKDHNLRLTGKTVQSRKKRSDTSPSKQVNLSPTKDNVDEESEDDIDGKKKVKPRRPRKTKKQQDKKPSKEPSKSSKPKTLDQNETESLQPEKPVRKRSVSKKSIKETKTEETIKMDETREPETKPGFTGGQCKRLAEESLEWDCGTSIESMEVKPCSPGTQTAESESEFCEESSQDNCESDSNSSISSNAHSQSDTNIGDDLTWTREEDKIILQTFQKENDKEHAYSSIAKKLTNRTVPQIRNRFQTLMTLLMEQLQ